MWILAAFGILAILFLIYLLLLAPGSFPKDMNPILWKTSYAHRGLHKKDQTVPENSLPAFTAAAKAGYGIELDVNLTKDGEVIVFHDDNLQRVCGVDRFITDCTYAELRQYRLYDTNDRIPRFSEVLDLVNGHSPFIIELKSTKNNDELCAKTAALLDTYKGAYCIESFHPGIVRWFRKNRPNVVRGQLSAGFNSYGTLPWYQRFVLSFLLINTLTLPHFVAYNHIDARNILRPKLYQLMGGKLIGWTVQDTDDIAYCKRTFDAIIFQYFRA